MMSIDHICNLCRSSAAAVGNFHVGSIPMVSRGVGGGGGGGGGGMMPLFKFLIA